MKIKPYELTATEAAAHMAAGRLSSAQLVQSCLDRIAETDGTIKAWAHLDTEAAMAQAVACDTHRQAGLATGPLHGIPVGLKDIIDTRDMPTQRGTPIFAGRQPEEDARVVEMLREAGAVIMGKTVTTELAFMHPSETRNPMNPEHSPGGSSSGSAAAVAAGHVPLAVGTQTNGSVIRPASFCGTFGLKPTRGTIPRTGVLQTSKSLDQLGTFARTLEDAALLADAIAGYDQRDCESFAHPRPNMAAGTRATPPVEPDLVWFDLPFNDRLSEAAREGFDGVMEVLGPRVSRMDPAEQLSDLVTVQARIHEYEIVQHQGHVFDAHWDQISETLKPILTRARNISQTEYEDAVAVKASAQSFFDDFFTEYDAILAPAAAGEAPRFGDSTGDPIFCTLWTLAGLPAVTLPLLVGETALPIGVQLIGPAHKDDRLLRTAAWVQRHIAAAAA
ncbi:glutamyl-tRNA amidotransferase subunit A [Roseobacter cerasinus]|uniref:Glutamyl-tRNA amidotransferase subunit A n=1 Tax=Roseobacter cerasinus TaxID=2602289 RepID=A0A640VPU7_9RHOB|nr:amidase [Roseobacter cerasinus]GFE49767.1 glutamyl-tRNA amidotransferase subunit A [Roseobacter cerasinus]